MLLAEVVPTKGRQASLVLRVVVDRLQRHSRNLISLDEQPPSSPDGATSHDDFGTKPAMRLLGLRKETLHKET